MLSFCERRAYSWRVLGLPFQNEYRKWRDCIWSFSKSNLWMRCLRPGSLHQSVALLTLLLALKSSAISAFMSLWWAQWKEGHSTTDRRLFNRWLRARVTFSKVKEDAKADFSQQRVACSLLVSFTGWGMSVNCPSLWNMPQSSVGLLVLFLGLTVFTPAPLEYHSSAVFTVLHSGLTCYRDTGHETSV